MMETHIECLLGLLAEGLHGRGEYTSSFLSHANKIPWEDVWRSALKQNIAGIVSDQSLNLPPSQIPNNTSVGTFITYINHLKKINRIHRRTLFDLAEIYESHGWDFVLLKGLSNAANYRFPDLHTPGDIDILFTSEEDYIAANRWAEREGFRMSEKALYEQAFVYNGIVVEHHRSVAFFGKPGYDRKLTQEIETITQENSWDKIEIEGKLIKCLPPTFNAFYLLQHIVHHFSYFGIGLKQVCDWAMHMKMRKADIDPVELHRLMELFDLEHPMHVFAGVCTRYLGFREEHLPIRVKHFKAQEEMAFREIITGGNFGHSAFEKKHFRNKWSRRWFMFKLATRRSMELSQIAPHHIKTIPLVSIANRMRVLFR